MPGLLDIASAPSRVVVRGTQIDVFGVSAEGIAYLLTNFPEIKAMFSGKEISLDPKTLATRFPKALAAIIASGTGQTGSSKAEAVAASLAVDEQAELLTKILELTFPRGVGPFVEAIQRLAGTVGAVSDVGSKEQDSTSPSPSKS
jgi:hypothetical protein